MALGCRSCTVKQTLKQMRLPLRFAYRGISVVAVSVAALCLSNPTEAQVVFTNLGFGSATRVSDDGTVVVGSSLESGVFRWTAATGKVVPNGLEGLYDSGAFVSGDGSVMAGEGLNFKPDSGAYRWTESGGKMSLGGLPGTTSFYARGMSGDGSTIVGDGRTVPITAVRWTAQSGTVGLGTLGGGESHAYAVSQDGSVVTGVSALANGTERAFRWTEADGMISIGTIGGAWSLGEAINSNGSIIAGTLFHPATFTRDSFLWSADTGMIPLGIFPGYLNNVARGLSDDGSIVIGGADNGYGYIWTPESGIRDFSSVLYEDYGIADQLAGWEKITPFGITPDGRYLVGSGMYDEHVSAWLLDRGLTPPPIAEGPPLGPSPFPPVPEPSTYGVFASFLLLGIIGWRRRANSKAKA